MADSKKSKSIESKIQELEGIIEKLENPDSTLDQSLELYKEGTDIIKSCRSMIEKVEQEIRIIENKEEK